MLEAKQLLIKGLFNSHFRPYCFQTGHHNLPLYPFLSLSPKLFFKMSPNLLIDSTKSLVLMVDEKKLTFLSFLETNLFVMCIMKKMKKFFASNCSTFQLCFNVFLLLIYRECNKTSMSAT